MRIRYFSDLHLEFKPDFDPSIINKGLYDVLIIAGDIGKPKLPQYSKFLEYVSKNFKKVFYVLGNHEYYSRDNSIGITQTLISEEIKKYHNISLLNCDTEFYEGYQFIGCTMWSHIKDKQYKINDVYQIPGMDIPLYNLINEGETEFLTQEINKPLPFGIKGKIIITHHVPSEVLIHSTYKDNVYNQWFYCEMGGIIELNKYKIKGWFYGHTHLPVEDGRKEFGVNFYSNPIGYPFEEGGADINKIIDI